MKLVRTLSDEAARHRRPPYPVKSQNRRTSAATAVHTARGATTAMRRPRRSGVPAIDRQLGRRRSGVAYEAADVLQQRGAPAAGRLTVTDPGDALETLRR